MNTYVVTGTFHGSIISARTEGDARRAFHKHYNGESIIMNNYHSLPIEGKSLIIGFVSNDEEHFEHFKEVNKHHTTILVNESTSLFGLRFNLLIYTEDSPKMNADFIKALKLRTVKEL
jgi:hypothetical protein